MASQARSAFDKNSEDILRLLEIHEGAGGNARGRRYRLEVLNKSAIVLITAFWEAYCEDLASEAVEHLVKHAKSADNIPLELRKAIAKETEAAEHQLEVWKLADDGWRAYMTARLQKMKESRDRKLNTPKTEQIDALFFEALGIKKVSSSWSWKRMTVANASKKLNEFVELRGVIAHRGKNNKSVTKAQVTAYFEHVKRLAGKTGGRVNTFVWKSVGKPLWSRKSR